MLKSLTPLGGIIAFISSATHSPVLASCSLSILAYYFTKKLIHKSKDAFVKRSIMGKDLLKTDHPIIQEGLSQYLASLLSLFSMLFLGFADDIIDIRWRVKIWLPFLASIPMLMVYLVTFGLMRTTVKVPPFLRGLVGRGQSLVLALSILGNNIFKILTTFDPEREAHFNSFFFLLPFVGVTCGYLRHNWYPATVFGGDTYAYFAGMLFAVVSIQGHFSLTVLLFMTPQIFNFLYSCPQIFRFIECPRHRMPTYNSKTDKLEPSKVSINNAGKFGIAMIKVLDALFLVDLEIDPKTGKLEKCNNLTLINFVLIKSKNKTLSEEECCSRLLKIQSLVSLFLFFVKLSIATYWVYSEIVKMKKQILTTEDLNNFNACSAKSELMDFLHLLNNSIKNKKLSDLKVSDSSTLIHLKNLFKTLKDEIKNFKPVENGKSRFGNPSFRLWFEKVEELLFNQNLLSFLSLGDSQRDEVNSYLLDSFGNKQRIDYGTGHELNFLCFLFCLYKLNIFTKNKENIEVEMEVIFENLVFSVFWNGYINLMRELQKVYWLEPAGSHGVWGLDDFHFLPFLFGSGQIVDHKHLKPKSVRDKEILEQFSNNYIYFDCVKFINETKSVGLGWHSPMLNDISGVKSWKKVNEGMFKMFEAEVLSKLPIMQHLKFGSLIHFRGTDFPEDVVLNNEHVHAFGQEFPTCCGMRIPSSIAANAKGTDNIAKPLPFD
ncbi:Serine/threonine-protein phosphatase 2A activator 2 [Clydaea vesicula]|uniref:Serine/threonine-protein phosphatase 2A activator n=1 Tax=Clydaea vesicula TaxID=447962 RepID=A0AAD5XVQ6_9FUNG|nr:Serine/threonine-protein phosphatase 2A activator 2 [Clydaea vesicula]